MKFPLYNYTHYSLQYGLSKPKELVKKCKDNGYKACGIADYKTISGAVSLFKECKKNDIKPIIGCSFDGFKIFAKNKQGWFDLIKILSTDDFSPVIDGNLIVVYLDNNDTSYSKYPLSYACPKDDDYSVKSFDEFYYTEKSDADIHRISLCSYLKTTIPEVQKDISKAKEYAKFFESDKFYVPNKEEIKDNFIYKELYERCEEYDILEKPMLPNFPTPDNETEEEYLKQLCREGWKEKLIGLNKIETEELKQEYLARFQEEFDVFKNANLFGYFLIVWDIINYINSKGWLTGPGRGSAAGCLISYLIGITKIDPIEFDLLMSRFYNHGRNTYDKISFDEFSFEEFEKACV